MQKKVQTAFVGLFCLLIFCNAQAAADSAHRALSLFSGTVVPSLFPFAVAASLLFELHALDPLARRLHRLTQRCFGFSGHFAYLFGCSALSGYPIGAKLTADLFRQNCLSREEAEALLCCVSTSGPMFLYAGVCLNMLRAPRLAVYLLLPHYLAALTCCLLSGRRFAREHSSSPLRLPPAKSLPWSEALSRAVSSCTASMLSVCALMVIYGVGIDLLSTLLLRFLPQWALPGKLALGLCELTTGCANSALLPGQARLAYLSFLCAFGGLCIHAQTASLAAAASLRLRHFGIHKSIQGLLSAAMTVALLKICPPDASCFAALPSAALSPTCPTWLTATVFLLCLWPFAVQTQKTRHAKLKPRSSPSP